MGNDNKKLSDDILNREIEKRLSQMEREIDTYNGKFTKLDYLLTFAVALICLILVIAGAFL